MQLQCDVRNVTSTCHTCFLRFGSWKVTHSRIAPLVFATPRNLVATVGSIGGSPPLRRSSPISSADWARGRRARSPWSSRSTDVTRESNGAARSRSASRRPPSEVAYAVRCAKRHGRSFVARGSGTGLAGGATPVDDPLVIVTTQMNRVLEVDVDARVAWVEPGLLNLDLSRAVSHLGLHYAPGSVVPSGLHRRRERRDQRRRPALPRRRGHVGAHPRPRRCARRRLDRPPRIARTRRARLRPAGLLRGKRGDDGHRDPDRRPAPAQPPVRADPAPGLHHRSTTQPRRSAPSSRPGSFPPRSR